MAKNKSDQRCSSLGQNSTERSLIDQGKTNSVTVIVKPAPGEQDYVITDEAETQSVHGAAGSDVKMTMEEASKGRKSGSPPSKSNSAKMMM
jgi:hypothetical protein